jgi:hypothetical protein
VASAVVLVGLATLLAPVLRFLLALLRTKSLLRSTTIPGPAVPNTVKGSQILQMHAVRGRMTYRRQQRHPTPAPGACDITSATGSRSCAHASSP